MANVTLSARNAAATSFQAVTSTVNVIGVAADMASEYVTGVATHARTYRLSAEAAAIAASADMRSRIMSDYARDQADRAIELETYLSDDTKRSYYNSALMEIEAAFAKADAAKAANE